MSGWRRRQILFLAAAASACGGGAKSSGEDRCRSADAGAEVEKLVASGSLDRAAEAARDAWRVCPSAATAHALATTLGELGRFDELERLAKTATDPNQRATFEASGTRARMPVDPDELLARAESAAAGGDLATARRLRDMALNRLEIAHGARASLALNDAARPYVRTSPKGRWIAIGDRTIVDASTMRELRLGGDIVAFSPDDTFLALDLGKRLQLRELATWKEVVSLEGTAPRVRFAESAPRAAILLSRDGKPVFTFVDLSARTSFELASIDERRTPPELDAAGRYAAWLTKNELTVASFAERATRKFDMPPETETLAFEGGYLDVSARSRHWVVIRLEDMSEVARATTGFQTRRGDSFFTYEDRTIRIRDLRTGAQRTIAVKPRPTCGDDWSWELAPDGKTLNGTSCIPVHNPNVTDRVTVELAKGTTRFVPMPRYGDADAEADRNRFYDGYREGAERSDERIAACEKAGGLRCSELFGFGQAGTSIAGGSLFLTSSGVVLTDREDFTKIRVRFAESRHVELTERWDSIAGTMLSATDSTGRTRLWDVSSGAVKWRGPVAPEDVTFASFASNGDVLTASRRGVVRRFSKATGRLERTWIVPGCKVESFAADDEPVVACRDGLRVSVYAGYRSEGGGRDPGKPTRVFDVSRAFGLDDTGRFAGTMNEGTALQVHPVIGDAPARTIALENGATGPMHLSGDWLTTTNGYGFVSSLNDGKRAAEVRGPIFASAIARDHSWAAFAREDSVEAVRLDASSRVVSFTGGPPRIRQLVIGAAGVFGASEQGELAIWTWSAPSSPRVLKAHRPVLALGPDGTALLGGGGAILASLPELTPLRTLGAVPDEDAAIALDGGLTASGDPAKARTILHCAIGPSRLPLSVCEGRFDRAPR